MDQIIKCPQCKIDNPVTNNYCSSCGTLIKTSLVNENQSCPFCQTIVMPSAYFCPNCSRKIREISLSSTVWKQIGIYLLSVFLPPLGLWPGIKYLRQNDPKCKNIGLAAIILTLLSSIITLYYSVVIINQVSEQVKQQLQNISY